MPAKRRRATTTAGHGRLREGAVAPAAVITEKAVAARSAAGLAGRVARRPAGADPRVDDAARGADGGAGRLIDLLCFPGLSVLPKPVTVGAATRVLDC